MLKARTNLFALGLLAAAGAAVTAGTISSFAATCGVGNFALGTSGIFKGTGQAEVDATELSLHLYLTDANGQQVRVDALDIVRHGAYFDGPAVIDGQMGRVFGRLDLARVSRLSATFVTNDPKIGSKLQPISGRFFGTLPDEPVNGEWAAVFSK